MTRGRKALRAKSGHHFGYHWHEGQGHDHEHPLVGHHGPAFGKKNVHEVGEPSLELLLHYSIEREKANRDD